MAEKVQLEISSKILKELFSLAKLGYPESINDENFTALVNSLKEIIKKDDVSADSGEESAADTKSILVVDDLGLVVYQLSLLLTKNGYNVVLARSSPEAFTIFEERGPFDIVLMDLFMPNKEDGTELLHKVKTSITENKLSTKVIVMSSTKDIDAIEEVIMLGADSFLEKGQNWKVDLLETLENL
jgi:CheY-like chemotaxis protein